MPASDPLKGKWKSVREHGQQMNRIDGDATPESDEAENEVVPPDEPVKIASAGDGDAAPADETSAEIPAAEEETFRELVQRANKGDEQAIARLSKVLDERPDIWRKIGDLASHARLSLIRLISGGDKLMLDSVSRKAEELLTDLSADNASPLERLAIERVVAGWLQTQLVDGMVNRTDYDLPQAKHWARCQHQAHRRFDAAVRQLTSIRQLLPQGNERPEPPEPALKVNKDSQNADDPAPAKGATA